MYRGLPIVEHGGALFGYRTEILRFPQQRFTVLCLCNLSTAPENLARNVADVFLEKSLLTQANQLQAQRDSGLADPSLFAGKYLDTRKHLVYSFTSAGADLMAWGANLRRVGRNQFRDLGTGTITFSDSENGMKATLEMDGEVFFAGTRIFEPQFSDAALGEFVGIYRSVELDATYSLKTDNRTLMLRSNWNPPLRLTPIARDEFDSDLGTLVFHRNANGRVTGLGVFTVNAGNVSFDKVD